ncbi:hypothetical protein [Rhizobium mongolense]|uniref:Uncharacterized protein n=2 Tax=Rhizobium mongolense TaxID=57676 RepID=A0ABR6IWA2_9HYPH|nr:hypothetical protein [Rhizobium mongolense]MBB4232196.1 hypothetical protein [Rhizobium mongolense]TVZ63084.1 hypothetical protein BCL32_3200 [Rhizobium mongolense USDA 1844]
MTRLLKYKAAQTTPGKLAYACSSSSFVAPTMWANKTHAPSPRVPCSFIDAARKFNRLRTSEKARRAKARTDYANGY